MEHVIRKCQTSDLSSLVELCKKHSDYEQAPYNPTGKRELLMRVIFSDRPKLFCYVIESHGHLAGYFTYTFDVATWDARVFLHLDCLYLEPEFRGYGIGALVFHRLKVIAKQHDCVSIQWQTPIFNKRAIMFYNRIGGIGKEKVRFFIDIEQID